MRVPGLAAIAVGWFGLAAVMASTTADWEKAYKVACYLPARIQQAHDLSSVYASGVTGQGATIVSELASALVTERSFCPERALVRALVTA